VLDVQASLFRKGGAYEYMEMPRNRLGCMFADKVAGGSEIVGVSTSRCYSYFSAKCCRCASSAVNAPPTAPKSW